MRRSLRLAAASAALVMVFGVAPVSATTPLDVHIVVPTVLPPDGGPTFGPFVATGPAVDAGLICPGGDTIDTFGKAMGLRSQTGVNFQVVKEFTCADGSGTFLVKLQVRVDARGDKFNWTIVDGELAYERLAGTGGGYGIPFDVGSGVVDTYEGQVHIE